MVQLNLALREINCKVVFFGCGLGGKTTNLEIIHKKAAKDSRGDLTSIATESDRTLFFDFMPLDLGTVGGMRVKFQLYTVPGQVYYNSTRKLVLRGADGVVFVADSQISKKDENIESLDNLEECLKEQGRSLSEMPHVIQFNKRDMPEILTVEQMNTLLNRHKAQTFEAVAFQGDGVLETFKALAGLLLDRVKNMSTESAAKPTVQAQRMAAGTGKTPASDRLRQASDLQRLQGGLAGATPPATAAPPKIVETRPPERRPAPMPLSETRAPSALSREAGRVMAAASTLPSTRTPNLNVVSSARTATPPGGARGETRRPPTTGMMISMSGRRRGSSRGLWIVVLTTLVVAASGAAYWFFLK